MLAQFLIQASDTIVVVIVIGFVVGWAIHHGVPVKAKVGVGVLDIETDGDSQPKSLENIE